MAKYLVFFISILVFVRCATPSYPTGGERDSTPPKVLSVSPPDSMLNFVGNEIVFKFNEFVQIENPQQTVLITPSPKEFPSIVARKKELVIKFKEALLDSTTYSISFNNGLKDLNEGNPLENFTYVFSTGPTLDSLILKGNLFFSETTTFPPNTFVGLYKNLDDSVLYKQKPDYIFNFKSEGPFQFNNLKAGSFRCFALSDKNFNFIYDLPSEFVGFAKDIIIISADSVQTLDLTLFKSLESKFRISNYSNTFTNGGGFIELNKPIDFNTKWALKESNDSLKILFSELNEERNIINFWLDNLKEKVNYKLGLFIKDEMVDSINVVSKSISESNSFLSLTTTQLNKLKVVDIKPDNILILKSSIPLDSNQCLNEAFLMDSISRRVKKIGYLVDNQFITINDVVLDTSYNQLIFPKNTLVSFNGLTNDSIVFNLKSVKANDLGSLKLSFELPSDSINYIIKIYNTNAGFSEIIRVNKVSNFIWFKENLFPGNYNLEIVFDENFDGLFTNGSINDFKMPEYKFSYSKPITLKNNWDLEENIVVSRETKSLPKIPDSPNKAVEQNTIKKGTNNPSSLIRE
ncbi:MAG: Ig-like domain-containing protein [Chitinophagales bacterium]|nr:Ig-like domain-containing protein [Chitinophagales bacterium]